MVTLGMLMIAMFVIFIVIFHQRRIILFSREINHLEEEKQKLLLDASIRFQEEERNRIAADLHDDAGPLLATARLYLNDGLVNQNKTDLQQSITSIRQILDDSITLIRNISHNLMPPTLKNFGLENACTDMFQKIKGSGIMKTSVRFHKYARRLTPEQELLVFRIIQELINNIFKHSKSTFLHLTQNVDGDMMFFTLQHDGMGLTQAEFDKFNESASGLGLKNIASRVRVLNGHIFFGIDTSNTFYKILLEVPQLPQQ